MDLDNFTDVLGDNADEIGNSQPLSLSLTPPTETVACQNRIESESRTRNERPTRCTGQQGEFRSVQEIDSKYRDVFSYPYFNLVQSSVLDEALYSDKSMVVCAPTGSGKTVVFEMAIVQLLMELDDKNYTGDFKIIYMAPVKALCSERLSEWYPKFTKRGLMCIEVTGDTDVDFSQLKPYRIIITTPEKWDMLTRRWRDNKSLVDAIKLFLIDEVHILNDVNRGHVLEAVVSRMKTIECFGAKVATLATNCSPASTFTLQRGGLQRWAELAGCAAAGTVLQAATQAATPFTILHSSADGKAACCEWSSSQSAHRIEQLQKQYQTNQDAENQNNITNNATMPVSIRFVAVSATVSNPEDVAAWLGTSHKPAVYYKFGDECRPVKLKRVVEGYPCSEGTSIFKFDIILNYKLWPVIKKYHDGKPTLIFCNTRKSVAMTAETLSRELTISFTPEQQARLSALASTIKNKKLQALVLSGVGCHHAGLLFEERLNIEKAFRNRDLPILITTTTLAMGVNLPAHLVIIKNTQQYINGAYQEYSISTVLQMVGRAGRPQFDTEATAVIMTRLQDKPRYQALVGGDEPLQSYLHKRLAENLNSEAALGTVCDVAQCVQWVRSTFLSVRAAKDPKRYLGLPQNAPPTLISKKIEELCVKAMNGLASTGLITMDEACCIESTEAGRLMSVYYLDLETMKHIMKIEGTETLEKLLWIVCESHELADMHLRVDERRILNALNRNNSAATIRFPMKGKINTRQMKLNCIIQAVLGCLPIPEPSLNQEAMKVMRIADRVCKCLVAYVTRPDLISNETQYFTAIVNAIILEKCIKAHLWENSPYVSKQLKGIGPTFSTLLATAGKVNFTLLEESHPRDLERIMNKGAPAGNVLRKQVSLLPKYQITAIPIDEKRISIQLLLLNQNQLAENRDQLTAGDSHRCYVVVGDSENYLLLFTSFMDKDLMNVYDGAITYEVTRKHNNEHRILIHCISSNWVGIDVNCEYLFKNIEPSFSRGEAINPIPIQDTLRKPTKKQTNITDVYKERKRKTNEIDITESKEKKKRQTALVEKFKLLKNSFEVTSKELKEDLAKSAEMSNMVIDRMIQPATESKIINIDDNGSFGDSRLASTDKQNDYTLINTIDLDDEDNFVIDEHINSIINEIETDILKTNNIPQNCTKNPLKVESSFFIKPTPKYGGDNSQIQHSSTQRSPNVDTFLMANKSLNEKRKHRSTKTKTNYSFMDNIEKNVMCDNDIEFPQKDNGFSDTIKSQIEKFLQSTAKTQRHDITIDGLLSCTENNSSSKNICPNQKTTSPKEDVNNCSIVESNKPLSLESPKVSVYPDNVQKVNQDIVNKPSKITCHSKKEHEDVVKEISTNTAKSDEVQNIDKIVEEIEREYNNIASKESYKKQECCADFENISKVNKFQDRKENDSKYFTNVTDNELHTITSKAECCLNEIITKDNIDNNSNTEKLEQCKARKKQVVENCNILAVNNVVSFMTIPKVSECDVHEFSKPLSINTILPTNLTVFDKLATTLSTDLCNNSNLYSITQCCPSKSKELVLNGDEIDQTVQPYDLDKRYHKISIQKDDNNEKDAENKMIITLLKPALPILNENSSLNNHVTHQNNYAEHNDRDSEKPGEGSENIMLNTTLVPTSPMTNMNISYNNHIAYPYSSTKYHDSASEEASKNEKPEKYINRYSFSATKINVSTKNLPDHEVKIIRKLKLDLDVTEIVSKGNKRETCNKPEITKEDSKYHRTDETEVGKTKRQEQYYSTSIDTMKMLQHLNGKKEIAVSDVNRHRHCSPQTEMDNQIISRNLIYIPTLKYPSLIAQKENSNDVKVVANNETDVEKYSPMAQTSVCLTNAGNHLHLVAQSSYNKPEKTKPEDAEMNLTERLTSSRKEIKAKTNNIEEIVQYKNYLRDIAGANNLIEKNADIVTSETKEKVTPVKNCLVAESGNTTKNEQCNETNIKSNKIENILHKFSAILRKNNFLNNNTDKNPSNIHVIRPPLEKTKNSYKISNIHSVHIPLPKNLIAVEASRSSRPANDYTFTTIKDIEKYEDNINPPRDDDNAQTEVVMKNNVPECFTDELPEDIPEYHSPDIDDPQEGTTNFDLDQSLLNPKLLLEQCFAKDESNNNELIIPPPSDFCDDENIYSPVKLGEITSQEYNETEQGITSNYDHDKSIFEDDNNSVLTPSVEIETWILPQDDEETYNGNAYNNSDFSKQRRTTTYNRGIFQKNEDSTYYLSSQIVNQKRNIANKSCTVMRRNHNISKDVSSLPQDFEINSRQGKLGYFKFTPKKKFKL